MSILAILKEETKESHAQLEKGLNLVKNVRTDEDYLALLWRFYTIYEPLENQLGKAVDWESLGWKFSSILKTPWLREDLLALGTTRDQIAGWPRREVLPTPKGLGEALGCLYVIEGSTLGGVVLSKLFRDTLGITPERGGRFFYGYGPATISSWKAFGSWADSQAVSTNAILIEQAVRGARRTFDAFSTWLS